MSTGTHSRLSPDRLSSDRPWPTAIGIRPALVALAGGWRFHRAHGATLRRARALSLAGDLLEVRRPRDWQPRSARLYQRTARYLAPVSPATAAVGPGPHPAPYAHRLLRVAAAPYRRAALALAALAAGLLAVVVLLGVLGCLVSPRLRARLFPRDLAARASWVASSAVPPNPQSGVGPATDRHDLFFHSTGSDHPWIEIDLGSRRVIRSLLIENRRDCCRERALPLNFEIFDEGKDEWRVIAQRRSAFEVWTRSFPAVRARRVRVRLAAASGILHLRRISLYEW